MACEEKQLKILIFGRPHLLLLALCLPLYNRLFLQAPRVAVVLQAVFLPDTPALVLHRLALHAPRPKRVLVFDGAAATSEQHAQPGHLGEGDHAGGVAGVQTRPAGKVYLDATSDVTKNVPGPKLSLLAGLVVQVDASAGETSAHSRGNWEEDEQQVGNSCQGGSGQHPDCLPSTCKAGQLEETGLIETDLYTAAAAAAVR